MAETFIRLEAEYCPPIDPALLSAILSDFDLSSAEDVSGARDILDSIRESAILEEAAGFDASGTGGLEPGDGGVEREASLHGTSTSQSKGTDITSISKDFSSLDFEEDATEFDTKVSEVEELNKLDNDTKVRLLQDLFGDQFSRYSLEHTLQKCNGKWNAAMEDLLNHVYFGENSNNQEGGSINAKGIDGFAEDNGFHRGRKGKGRARKFKGTEETRTNSLPGSRNGSPMPATNRWKSAQDDIDFLATRTGIATKTVSSVYYESGASVSKTITALVKLSSEQSKHAVIDETAVASRAQELSQIYPTIHMGSLAAIVRLTDPSMNSAHELVTAMVEVPKESTGGIQIVPRYSRPQDLDIESSTNTRKPKSATSSRSASSEGLSATARRDAYDLARVAAISQANAARRKAKSDHLMGGAASYYSQVSRDYAALSSGASSQAADELAASQSTSTQLDLHGIDVRNAVRIAREKAEAWWEGLGEKRINGRLGVEDRQAGFRIVVGLGRHSEGGQSKLAPAVMKTLKQEGWRVEHAGGVLLVKGPPRK